MIQVQDTFPTIYVTEYAKCTDRFGYDRVSEQETQDYKWAARFARDCEARNVYTNISVKNTALGHRTLGLWQTTIHGHADNREYWDEDGYMTDRYCNRIQRQAKELLKAAFQEYDREQQGISHSDTCPLSIHADVIAKSKEVKDAS